jgi:hypothetical protein
MAKTIFQQKINNVIVKPVIPDGGEPNPEKIKGFDFIPLLYANIFLCAKKKSGKTNLIHLLLSELVTKDAEVYIFASTVYKDATYEEITKMLEKKKVKYETYTSFIYHRTGENILQSILDEIDAEAEKDDSFSIPKPKGPRFLEPERKKKSGAQSPERIFVFDDLGQDLRDPNISQLLKTNRHNKCKVILSSQYLTDLQPQAIKQLDFVFLFRSFNEEKLVRIYELLDLSIPLDRFITLYHFATAEPYNFLYVNVRQEQFRKNFNTALIAE